MLRLPLALVLGIEAPPKRQVFDQLCASREGSSSGGGGSSRSSSQSPLPSSNFDRRLVKDYLYGCQSPQGYLPANVLQLIITHVEFADLKALHRVSRAWREAVCYGLHTAAPTTCNPAMLKRFPKIETIGMERIRFTEPHLAELSGLRTLIMHDCSFEHPISDLAALTGLERLKLLDVKANCKQADHLLSHLTSLTALEIIRLSGQRTLPSLCHLNNLKNLKELSVSDSHHRERLTHLTKLSHLQKLQRVKLLKVRVDSSMMRAMAGLTDLHTLEIPDCYRVTDPALPSFSLLTGLTRLDLRSTYHRREEDLTNAGISHLSSLTRLCALNLAGHKGLTSTGIEFLSTFTDLAELSLMEVPLWTGGAAFLAPLTKLTSLNLARTHLVAEQLTCFGALNNIRALDVSETFFGDEAAKQIALMPQLETLKAAFCPLHNEGIETIVHGCPHLSYLAIDGCWISTLCLLRTVWRRPKLRMWTRGTSSLPNWMYKIDTVLIAQSEPYARRLRVLHQGEGTVPKTCGVLLAVLLFFIFYFAALFAVFSAVFLLPLAALGVLCLIVGVLALAFKIAHGTAALLTSLVTSCSHVCGISPGAGTTAPEADPVADMV